MASRALALVPRRQGITVADGAQAWMFSPTTSGSDHFWSVDGSICRWCNNVRSAADVHKWDKAGRPAERCATPAEIITERLIGL